MKFKAEIHPYFSIHGRQLNFNDLVELSYSFIKEGEAFEKHIGQFLLDWIDNSSTISVITSGSTGIPKTIVLKKEHMINSALATGSYFKLSAKNSALLCLPATYIAGKMMLVRALVLGLDLYLFPPSSNPLDGVGRSFHFGAMVPLQVSNSLLRLHQIKNLIIGGAPISSMLRKDLKHIANASYETYGMTETITHIAVKPLNNGVDENIPFSILPDIDIAKDERSCLVINAPKISDEVLKTNDVVDLVSSNKFKWLGRYDNVINSGGVKLHPENIENVLSQYLSIPFFVIGVDDEALGQKVVLIIEGHSNIADIQKAVNAIEEFENYEKPRMVLKTAQFNRTKNGKIQRHKTLEQILRAS